MVLGLAIAGLALLILITAFLAAAETSLLRISRIRVRYLIEKKVEKASRWSETRTTSCRPCSSWCSSFS
jgi:Mg2+/Co2+ transporter CorB